MLRSLAGVVLLICSALAGAAELTPAAAADELRARLAGLDTFAARFEQRVSDANGRIIDEGSGEFWLARPGRFRWQYETPWPRLLLADGESLWLFDEELEQVTVRDTGGLLDDTPAAIFAGRLELLDRYRITGSREGDWLRVQLEPADAGTEFRRVAMRFAGDELVELELFDQFGQVTQISFAGAQANPQLDAALFRFAVPEGADVIDERDG